MGSPILFMAAAHISSTGDKDAHYLLRWVNLMGEGDPYCKAAALLLEA